jgi:hypothetical protein
VRASETSPTAGSLAVLALAPAVSCSLSSPVYLDRARRLQARGWVLAGVPLAMGAPPSPFAFSPLTPLTPDWRGKASPGLTWGRQQSPF